MATRLYFKATEAAPVNPGFDGAWGYTGEALRRALSLVREYGDTPASGAQIGPWTPGQVALDRQYVSPPLSGAQTITGIVKLYLLAREFASTDNATSRLGLRVVSNDGITFRGTVLAVAQYGPNTELSTGLRNKGFADGDAVASVNAQDGDRIVVEVGYTDGIGAAGTTPEAQAQWGAEAKGTYSDLPENETATAGIGWVEFSQNLAFQDAASWRVTQQAVEVLNKPSDQHRRLTQQAVEVLNRPTDQHRRVSQLAVEVLRNRVHNRWSDDPVTTTSPIRLAHINELRRTLDFWRAQNGLPAFSWTDAPYVEATTPIKAVHFTEMRSAIQDLWTDKGMGTIPDWTGGAAPAAGGAIRASHVNDLRLWTDLVDPPLDIWTGFHWCSPVTPSNSTAAQTLLQSTGRWGAVIVLRVDKEGQGNYIPVGSSAFKDACDKVMDAREAVGGGRSLDQCIARIFFATANEPDLTSVSSVTAARTWLSDNKFYEYLNYFVANGGRNAVIFNELLKAGEPQYNVDPRVMGYLSYALVNDYYNGGNRLLYTLFPGPDHLQQGGAFTTYWDKYDLRTNGPDTHVTFGQYDFGDAHQLDSLLANRTMLWHGGTGVFDRIALHCYADSLQEYEDEDPGANKALNQIRATRDLVDPAGWVYVTETSGTGELGNPPACDSGDTADNGTALAAFMANANQQFGGSFLQAVYGYILETSDGQASSDGKHLVGDAFIGAVSPPAGWLGAKSFP